MIWLIPAAIVILLLLYALSSSDVPYLSDDEANEAGEIYSPEDSDGE